MKPINREHKLAIKPITKIQGFSKNLNKFKKNILNICFFYNFSHNY